MPTFYLNTQAQLDALPDAELIFLVDMAEESPTPDLNSRADYVQAALRFCEQGLLCQSAIDNVQAHLAESRGVTSR